MKKKTLKVNSWKELKSVSKVLIEDGKEVLIVPMGVHGLHGTKPVTNELEATLEQRLSDEEAIRKHTASIILIGSDY